MVDDLIKAVKTRLGISSPSKVMKVYGEDTGEGFVLGLKEETANAFKAGEQLGAAAADGARAGSASAVVAGKTTAVAAASTVPAVPVAALDSGEKKAGKLAGTFGKLGGTTSKLGGFFKTLGGGLSALVGGPFGLLLISIPLIIKGFQLLYKNSPQFRKFVDTIVKAVKPLIDIIGKFLLKVLNDFFGWVNSKMPTIKRVMGDVFNALQPIISAFGDIIAKVFPVVQLYFKVLFEAIKFYVTKILIPVWATVFRVIRALLPIVINVFGAVIATVRKVFNAIGAVWNKVLRPTFNGIKSAVRTVGKVISTVFSAANSVFDGFKNALDKVFKKVRTIVDNIKSAFGEIKGAVTGAFGGLWDAVKGVLGSFVNLLNSKLIDGVNGVISKFGVPKIPHIPGFAEGGYTGPGAKNQFAGVVHADEFVVKKSSRRAIEAAHPGLLDRMNKTGEVGTGGLGIGFPDIPGVGKLKDLAGETIGGIKNIGEKIAKEGVGKVLEAIVKGAEGLMGGAGIHRGKFISDFLYGIMDSIAEAAKNWGGKKGQQPGGVIPDVGSYTGPPGGWTSPLRGHYPITQYANRGHNPPWAIDIGAPSGSQVQAASSGIVVTNANLGNTSYGRYIQIAHAHGISTLYAHLAASLVSIGKKVATGQLIGVSGNSGHTTGPHLHFEIKPSHDTLEELRKRGVRLAKGGVARATDGGIPALIAEAGKNERVEPLDSKGLSKRDKEILKMFEGGRKGDLVVNINNPEPERASQSVSRAIRDKAFSSGWSM
jgi:murein DD-endopeptidase MepM/ murein hydrolase activator NlpD